MNTKASIEHLILNVLISSLVTMEAMEQLMGTEAYRREVKQSGQRFFKELLAYTGKNVPFVFGVEDKTLYALMDYNKELIEQLVRLRPEDLAAVSAFLDQYAAHPRKTLNRLEVKIVDQVHDEAQTG